MVLFPGGLMFATSPPQAPSPGQGQKQKQANDKMQNHRCCFNVFSSKRLYRDKSRQTIKCKTIVAVLMSFHQNDRCCFNVFSSKRLYTGTEGSQPVRSGKCLLGGRFVFPFSWIFSWFPGFAGFVFFLLRAFSFCISVHMFA